MTTKSGWFSFWMFHPMFHVTPSTCSFPKKGLLYTFDYKYWILQLQSAQIPTDFNKYVYELGRNFTITALAKQIIVTDSFCSSSLPKQAGRQCYNAVPAGLPVSNSSEQSVSPIINLCFRKDCFITVSTQGTDWPQPEARWQLFPKL